MRPHDALFSKKFDGSALGVHEIELARFPWRRLLFSLDCRREFIRHKQCITST